MPNVQNINYQNGIGLEHCFWGAFEFVWLRRFFVCVFYGQT
jgi:hypothetical protein